MKSFGTRHTFELLNRMLDDAISGNFRESDYDETELSKLEVKWMRFLTSSASSHENLAGERQAIQELVSDISHQVKTSAANIRLYGELLEERLDGEDRDLVRHLLNETELLEFLIQSLVKMSRLEADTIQLLPENQPLLPLLSDIEERGLEKQLRRRITLAKAGWDQEIRAVFDRKWTAEAVYNILDNAYKYSPEGSTVTIGLEEYNLFTRIRITDQGPGVTTDEVPLLFDRFYRSPRFKDREGVGLGLSLAREIIRKEGGYIKVSSVPGSGAEFSVYLRKS